jgi:alpha-mannosidase
VVSHTHWDREWYLTFSEFRVLLVRTVRRVLDALERDPSFRHFVLDGQAVVLEDYLEVRPEDRPRIERLVRGGSLSVGPWYVLPDEFLVSGEALVRNLLIGHAVARGFGPVQKVGYLPDTFGHTAQMPQVLRRAGIDSFVYTRGSGDELDGLGLEYRWRAPDGSEVLAVNQWGGYCNAGGLGHEEIWHAHTRREVDLRLAVERVRDSFAAMGERSNVDVWLLNNGCDHFPPQARLGEILDALRAAFPRTEFVHASFAEFVDDVRRCGAAVEAHEGELLSGKHHPILTGVWSARMPIKQDNDLTQSLLVDCLEPLCSHAHFMLGREYPSGAVAHAWRTLLRNHPHDSICGCSTDEVHRQMLPRFAEARETAEQLIRLEMESLAPTFARRSEGDRETVIAVANPLPARRTEVVTRLVVLQPPGVDPSRLRLLDETGRAMPMKVLESRRIERFWGIDYRTALSYEAQRAVFDRYVRDFAPRIVRPQEDRDRSDQFLTIQFLAEDLPGVGHACFRLVESAADAPGQREGRPAEAAGGVSVSGDTVGNEQCAVTLHGDGTLELTHKPTGRVFRGLNALEDTEDVGDEYDHSPASETLTVSSRGAAGAVRVVEDTGFAGALEASFAFRLPAGVEPDRARRSKTLVDCPVAVRVRLTQGDPVVDVELRIENRALDHRLRAVFPTGITTRTVLSDGHFLVNERPVEQEPHPDWLQPPAGTVPQQEFSAVEDAAGGLAVLARGLPEVQPLRAADGTVALALTLLRCVGWLSRDDFPTRRRMNAGPTIPTPDAQCPGPHAFRYALLPYAGTWSAAGVKRESRRWRTPPLVVQGVSDLHAAGAGLLEAPGDPLCVTAVKKGEERDSLVVRLVNLGSRPATGTLRLGREVERAWRTGVLEERAVGLRPSGREVTVEAGPHEILTLELQFAGRDG